MLAERLFRLALRVYPRRFCDHVGGEMCLLFRQRYQDTLARRGRVEAACLLLSEMLDVVKAAASEWRTKIGGGRRQQQNPQAPRSTRGSSLIEVFGKDVRFAARSLARSPAFTVVVAMTLALGIGGTSALFSVVNAVLLEPLPYHAPDRLVVVWEQNYVRDRARNVINPANYTDWREQNTVFTDMAAWAGWSFNLTGGGPPERLSARLVTPDLFSVLGVSPALGRTFVKEDGESGNERMVVLSHRFWRRRFGPDAAVVGRTVTLDGIAYQVVGVMPKGFSTFPATALAPRRGLMFGHPWLWATDGAAAAGASPCPSPDSNRLPASNGRRRNSTTSLDAWRMITRISTPGGG